MLVLTLALIALPMMGQDFMNVYFKDGTERTFHLSNVEELVVTCTDADGVLHSNYDYQHIITAHGDYVYALKDIDSIRFTKYDEEQVLENLQKVVDVVIPSVSDCETVSEAAERIDQIKRMDGVEDAWIDGNVLSVKVTGWKTIHHLFTPHKSFPNDESSLARTRLNNWNSAGRALIKDSDGLTLRAVVANQQHNDDSPDRVNQREEYMYKLCDDLNDAGFEAEYRDNADMDFFYNDMYDYDIVLLSTHGVFSRGQHILLTSYKLGEKPANGSTDKNFSQRLESKYNELFTDPRFMFSEDDIGMYHCDEYYIVDNQYVLYSVYYAGIKESFFTNTVPLWRKFAHSNSIFFNAACESLLSGNSLANTLINNHGLGTYVGYTQSNYFGQEAGCTMFWDMLNGISVEKAFSNLANHPILINEDTQHVTGTYKDEDVELFHRDWLGFRHSDKHYIASVNLVPEKPDISRQFITPVFTSVLSQEEVNRDFMDNGTVVVDAITTTLDASELTMGFLYGLNSHHLTNNVMAEAIYDLYYPDKGNTGMAAKLTDLEPGNTYYYCAYTFDGQHHNYGDTCSFYLEKPKDLKLSAGSFCIDEGKSTTIDITGNGEYDIFNGNEKVTKVTLEGEKLTIEAIGAGESTIIVTDKKTGNTAPIEVTVWARLSIAIIGNIDLEVGDKTNVRIMSGNNDYTLDSDYPKVATPTLIGEFVSVEALSAGKATITVTDNKTGQTASFTVTVNDSTPIDIPAETIDLGLPSGTLWASYNIGATKPEEYGSYFAWGETEQKEKCGWYNYTHCNGSENTCFNLGSDISGTKYDVAHTKWGGEWCLPTLDQVKELINKCSSTWTTVNGVNGLLFTGPNGKTIFFPAAGYLGGEVLNTGSYGYYWSGGQDPKNAERAYNLAVYNGTPNWLNNYRFAGFSVRPVINGTPSYADLVLSTYDPININVNAGLTFLIVSGSGTYAVESSNEAVATVTLRGNYVDVSGVAAGTATITVIDVMSGQRKSREVTVIDNTPLPGTPAEAIDLGLPSGTLWASYNIGASKPEEYGSYLAWGETEEKDFYNENTYLYKETDIGTNIAGTIYDVAHILWGGSWQMPNKRLLQELFKCCSFEWITVNGVKGGKLTGPNGNSIFMPAGEWKVGYGSNGTQYGAYWSSEQGKGWRFYMGTNDLFSCSTYIGLLVRPVIPGKTGDIPGQAIDLGLPSGTKWASYNVGATAPDDYGGYYAWGETEEKEVYELKNYIHCDGDDKTYHNIGENIIGTEYDVATVRWGSSWHMPTKEQFEELINNCSVVYGKTQNGVYGIQYTGPNGNKIFLPATGHKIGNTYYQYRGGRYWTGQLVKWDDYVSDSMCDILSFERNTQGLNVDNDYGLRYMGLSVRPVTNE